MPASHPTPPYTPSSYYPYTNMHKTRSTTLNVRFANGSPLSRGLSPRRRRARPSLRAPITASPLRPPPLPATPPASPPASPLCPHPACSHDPASHCYCATTIRPPTATVQSKSYTATLLAKTLKIHTRDIDIVSGYTYYLHSALMSVCSTGAIAEHGGPYYWRIIDTAGKAINWHSAAAVIIAQPCALYFPSQTLDTDPHPALPAAELTWQTPESAAIDLATGTISSTTVVGRDFVCYAFIPALMRLLHLGGEEAFVRRLWMSGRPECRYYVYHMVNRGFGKFGPARRKVWSEHVAERRLRAVGVMVARHEREISGMKEVKEGGVDGAGENALVHKLAEELAMLKLKITADEERVKRERDVAAAKLQELQERVEVVENRPVQDGTMDEKIAELGLKTTAIETVLGARIEFVNQQLGTRLDAVDSRVAKVDSDLVDVHAKLIESDEKVEGKFINLSEKLNQVDGKFIGVDEKVTSLSAKLTEVASTVQTQGAELDSLHTEQQSQQRSINASLDTLKSMMSENLTAIRGPNSTISLLPPPQPAYLYYRIRQCPQLTDDTIPDAALYRSIFSSNEPNKLVSRTVTTQLSPPFLIVLMGYSGAGKTHTAFGTDGLFSMLVQRLPPVAITVYEIAAGRRVLGMYEPTMQNLVATTAAISDARATEPTAANSGSSRSHLVVVFNSLDSNAPYGILVDVAGCEESENMAELAEDMASDSRGFGRDNMYLRKLLEELVVHGKKGFVSRKQVSIYKRVTVLNREVAAFLGSVEGGLAVRVLLCAVGEHVFKTSWKETGMWEREE